MKKKEYRDLLKRYDPGWKYFVYKKHKTHKKDLFFIGMIPDRFENILLLERVSPKNS